MLKLMAPSVDVRADPALVEEVRQLVVARNERRAAPAARSRSTSSRRSSASCESSRTSASSPGPSGGHAVTLAPARCLTPGV